VALDAPVTVADVEVTFQRLEAGRVVQERLVCKAPARFVAAADAQGAPTPSLDAVVAIAQLVRTQIEAEEAARHGRYQEARRVMVLFQSAVVARRHDAIGSAAGTLADSPRDPAAYGRTKGYRSSMRKGASRGVSSLYEEGAEADLRAMGRAGKTSAQESMEKSFGAGAPSGDKAPRRQAGRLARKRSRRW
jgi:hypothetical protein